MSKTQINRRDVLMMTSGAAALCLGRLAHSVIPSASVGSDELQNAADRLQHVPTTFGSWTSTPGTISDREQRVASIHSYIRREYANRDSGYRVGLTLLCGPTGPMAVHPPTACFEGVGYVPISGPMLTSVARSDQTAATPSSSVQRDEFNKATFRLDNSTTPQTVRVFWGWSSNGDWSAPTRPRVAFRGLPWLYKLYVTDQSIAQSSTVIVPQAETFLREALPVLRKHLNNASTQPDSMI